MHRLAILCLVAALALLVACSDDEATGPAVDAVPPATIEDLSAAALGDGSLLLTWTAPGDDGMDGPAARYQLRRSVSTLSEQNWASADSLESAPLPGAPGDPETLYVAGLAVGIWYFGAKACDDAGNWSELSNVASATAPDVVAPAAVTDLRVASSGAYGVVLAWTAPGDDQRAGTATAYDVRVSEAPITLETWGAAVSVPNLPVPAASGTVDSLSIETTGLGHHYYFALRTSDEAGNWSELSNPVDVVPGLHRLTTIQVSGRFGASEPAWSSDGMRIAFSGDWAGDKNIYYQSVAQGGPVRLTTHPEPDYAPTWAPSGDRIAYTSRWTGTPQIWIVDAAPGAQPRQLTTQPYGVYDSAWSPDGTRVLYAGLTRIFPPPTSALFTIPWEGGASEVLHDDPSVNLQPAWSANGQMIAFVSGRTGNHDVWVLTAIGGSLAQLTDDPADDEHPAWSPDGTRVAFASIRSGNYDIWIAALDETTPVRLTFEMGHDTEPAWSPDGSRIAFASSRAGQNDIWIQELE